MGKKKKATKQTENQLPLNQKKRTDADSNATEPLASQGEMRLQREGHDM